MAESAKSAVELRDPHANYNKMSLADLKREIPGIQWDLYFSTLGLKEVEELNVAQMAAVKESADLMNEMDMNV